MDGITINAALRECDVLIGGKIDKIQQPEQDLLLFTVRNNSINYKLYISSHPETGRIHLTDESFPNPINAPLFCMLLRKRLMGGRIDRIEQSGIDRVVTFYISSRDELGDSTVNSLVVEIMGKYSNITLVDREGVVVDCMKRVGPQMSSVRTLLPGVRFQYMPPQTKTDPFAMTFEECQEMYQADPDRFSSNLATEISGMSKKTADVLTHMSSYPPRLLVAAIGDIAKNHFSSCVLLGDSGEILHCMPFIPDMPSGSVLPFPSLHQALDYFYRERNVTERIQRHSRSLKSSLSTAIGKCEKKIALHREALLSTELYEKDKLYGDLITANIYQMHKGQQYLKAVNYCDSEMPEITVSLDPLLTPVQNAQKYYRRYRKAVRAAEFALEQLSGLQEELDWLNTEMDSIDTCETVNELEEIKADLLREGFIKEQSSKGKKQKLPASKPMCFVSRDGITVLVGKNNLQNDRITANAAPDNIWLHVKNAPGSHVVIQSHGLPPEDTLNEGLLLAAWYSSQRNGVNVAVDYTLRKYVKKPSGARPGFVIFSTNKTAYITPDKSAVKSVTRKE